MTASAVDLTLYAPQARLFDLASNEEVATTTSSDLVSVQVTLVNTGAAQVSMTLNNQAEDPATDPVFPPWRYNDLVKFKPGQRIRVDFRYGRQSSAWQTLIVARIVGVSFSFPAGGGARLTLTGEDLLSLLKINPQNDTNHQNKDELQIVRDSLSSSNTQLTLASDAALPAGVSGTLRSVLHQKTTSYLQFITGIADRLDFEVFVDNGAMNGGVSTGQGAQLHFAQARSITAPTSPLVLQWGGGDPEGTTSVNITDFNPKLEVADQYNTATAGGANPSNSGHLQQQATVSDILPDLHGDNTIVAPAVRDLYYLKSPGETQAPLNVNTSNLDPGRARQQAVAELRKKARQLVTVEGSTVGSLDLRAGIHVQVNGLRPPFDGIYYVTKATHSLDAGGYKTQFTLRRPGITDPSLFLASPSGGG
jgi:phage protein D